ncbi:MAG: GGDEF domain-containing protein [Coleofasciculaceae cyanobacterium]
MATKLEIPRRFNNYLEHQPIIVILVAVLLVFPLIAYLDYQLTSDISLSFLYLLPVSMITWFINIQAGLAIAFVSAIAGLITHPITQQEPVNFWERYWDTFINFVFFSTVSYLVFKLRRAKEKEKDSARTDLITGLANKKLFFELARLEIKKSHRYRHPLTVIYIDIDDFAKINRTLGYSTGDHLIKIVAITLQDNLRETDIIARVGGDEFVILLSGNGYEAANTVISRVRRKLMEAMRDNHWPATFSIGAVTFINPPNSVTHMIEQADHALYVVKNSGKNQLKHKTST